MPRYVTALEEAVQGGDSAALRQAVEQARASIEALDDETLRAAGRELLKAAERASAEDLERQVRYWIRDRALYQERVVARTEAARAHTAAYVEQTRDSPWVKG